MNESSSPRRCAACDITAPTTETNYTLIGAKHAWRCKKITDAQGAVKLEWYCPECWRAKGSKADVSRLKR